MKYQKKNSFVEAFQWTGNPNSTTPEWFREAEKAGLVRVKPSSAPLVDAFVELLCVDEELEALRVYSIIFPGEFVLLDEGEIHRATKDLFEQEYQPFSDKVADRDSREFKRELANVLMELAENLRGLEQNRASAIVYRRAAELYNEASL